MAQTTSELWKTLWNTKNTKKEYAFDINGVWYDSEAETEHNADSALYSDFSFGNAHIATLSLSLYADNIPRGAQIKRYMRLVNGAQVSEWLPKGVFYANRRPSEDGYWTIEAFDPMRKADIVWEVNQSWVFPMPMPDAVAKIAAAMGVEIDSRTVLNDAYTVDYPVSDQTMRQTLARIAAAHGGNFVMTDAGKLRLVPLKSAPPETGYLVTEYGNAITFGGIRIIVDDSNTFGASDGSKFYVGLDIASSSNNGKYKPVSRVTLLLDDENCLTAGDDTGFELVADCPYATQEMVNALLAELKGYEYQSYEADAANIDPAAELGDGVTVDGMYSVIAQISDDGMGYPTLSAPGKAELDDEYPSDGPLEQKFNRKISKTYSVISKTAEEIRLEVQGLGDKYTALAVTVDGVTVTTSNEDGTKTITLKDGVVTADAIAAGAVTADKIAAGAITADNITLTGSITWNDLSSGVQSTINGAYNAGGVSAEQVTIITQNSIATASISANQISTGTLQAASVSLEGLMEVKNDGTTHGYLGCFHSQYWGVTIADSTLTNFCYVSTGGAKIASGSNEVYVISTGCYSTSAITVASDCRLKNSIKYDMEKYEEFFMSLKPCSYYLNSDKEVKRHWGFIAQDFAKSITAAGFEENELAALGYDGEHYGIGYTELVALNTHMIQKIYNALIETGVIV